MIRPPLLPLALLVALVGACDDAPNTPAEPTDAAMDVGLMFDAALVDAGSGCTPSPEICNGVDDDCDGRVDDEDDEVQRAVLVDPANCGACGVVCAAPNAELTCQAGVCVIAACAPGFGDYNADAADGCETDCVISNGGIEQCDAQDNDCDGAVDEGFDLQTDLAHCGACGAACPPFADGALACVAGACVGTCNPGHHDLDGDAANGCEYTCDRNATAEIREYCNGLDDDCDGLVDEAADRLDPPDGCGELGVCGAQCTVDADCADGDACLEGVCVAADGGPDGRPCAEDADCQATHPGYGCLGEGVRVGDQVRIERRCRPRSLRPMCDADQGYRCVRDPAWRFGDETDRCDARDNDCDGRADEDFVDALLTDDRREARPCAAGLGVCQRQGTAQCAPDGRGTTCSVRAGDPLGPDDQCDGVDDDCDGLLDEAHPDPLIPYPGFAIFAFEASRPGADADTPGRDPLPDDGRVQYIEARACARADVLPWTDVTFPEAAAACEAAGYRLCRPDEWALACGGPEDETYPYGPQYDALVCNGGGFDADPAVHGVQDALQPTGATAPCERRGVYDLSGNAKEWVDAERDGLVQVRGGGFETNLAPGLMCSQDEDLKAPDFRHPAIGFRCCVDLD